jgi:hypothetical protein
MIATIYGAMAQYGAVHMPYAKTGSYRMYIRYGTSLLITPADMVRKNNNFCELNAKGYFEPGAQSLYCIYLFHPGGSAVGCSTIRCRTQAVTKTGSYRMYIRYGTSLLITPADMGRKNNNFCELNAKGYFEPGAQSLSLYILYLFHHPGGSAVGCSTIRCRTQVL